MNHNIEINDLNYYAEDYDLDGLIRVADSVEAAFVFMEQDEMDDKYYIMFEIGVGTGLQLQDILKFKNKDIRGKDSIEASIGTKNIRRTFLIPPELKEII